MELLYLFVEDYLNFKNKGFNFSSRYHLSEMVTNRSINITINTSPNFVESYFDPKFANVTAIVGKNGVGKSNLFSLLTRILTNSSIKAYFGLKFLVMFKDGDKIKVYHTLFDASSTNMQASYNNEWEIIFSSETILSENLIISRVSVTYNIDDEPFDVQIPDIHIPNTIIYNPLLDLRDYPPSFSFEKQEEIDVSTNSLISKDSDDLEGDHHTQLAKHKYRNIERQLNSIISMHANFGEINIPLEMEVIFDRAFVNERNLNPRNSRIFKILATKLNISNGLSSHKKYKELYDQIIVSFLESIVFYFFSIIVKNDEYQNDSLKYNLEPEDLDRNIDSIKDLINYIKEFFTHQNFIEPDIVNKLIDDIVNIIDSPSTRFIFFDNRVLITSIDNAKRIWTSQYIYLEHFESSQFFIHLNWRNMSSGEKAYLDLYSRFDFAHSIFMQRYTPLEEDKKDKIKTIYFFIDEAEAGFHPLWQQEFFNNLHDFLKRLFANVDAKLQLFISSHSPFLLSDLPSSNTLLMDKGAAGETIIYNNSDIDRKTLGTNIHELLDDSFFLPKGAIGAFARTKINDLIEKLNSEEDINLDGAESLINAIGDDFLREKLAEMLDEKRPLEFQIRKKEEELENLRRRRFDA
jgi:hypothetical protein